MEALQASALPLGYATEKVADYVRFLKKDQMTETGP